MGNELFRSHGTIANSRLIRIQRFLQSLPASGAVSDSMGTRSLAMHWGGIVSRKTVRPGVLGKRLAEIPVYSRNVKAEQ